MTLEELQNEWNSDCKIDDDHLDRESVRTPAMHAKYLHHLISHKHRVTSANSEYAMLRTKKFRYYRGEMSKGELELAGWEQWQGIKPLRNEMDEFLNGDSDLIKAKLKIEYLTSIVEYLESILNQIKARDWQIRNAIQWKQFISGA
jgi:hypothetical protein